MNYLAILGRQPELGLVELEAVIGSSSVATFGRHAIVAETIPLVRLGGVIKLGRIIARLPIQRLDQLDIDLGLLPLVEGKLTFGVSAYGLPNPINLGQFGLRLKRALRGRGSVRLIATNPGSNELSAAQLKYNHLPRAGFELLIASNNQEIILALTEQYQDIDAYSARDHGRPARSASVGMLPPKLAQILVNTTASMSVYDPFCGTGVILQEALLLGRRASGCDLSPEMVAATRTNLEWLASQSGAVLPDWEVAGADARQIKLPGEVAIVSEGYLGPHLSAAPKAARLRSLQAELGQLYRDTLANLAVQLPVGSEVSICLPAWRVGNDWHLPTGVVDDLSMMGYTSKVFTTVSGPLRYARSNQTVGRHILLLTRT